MPQGVSTRHITLFYAVHIRLDRCRADIIVMSARHMLTILCRAAHILCNEAHVHIVLHGIRFLCIAGQGYAVQNLDMPCQTFICNERQNICRVRINICRVAHTHWRIYAVQDIVPCTYALESIYLWAVHTSINAYCHGVSTRSIIYLVTQRWLNIRRVWYRICRAVQIYAVLNIHIDGYMPCRT